MRCLPQIDPHAVFQSRMGGALGLRITKRSGELTVFAPTELPVGSLERCLVGRIFEGQFVARARHCKVGEFGSRVGGVQNERQRSQAHAREVKIP